MGNHESEVVLLPRPAGHRRADKIQAEEEEPEIEPGRAIDVSAGDAGTKSGLEKSGRDADSRQGDEQEHGEVNGAQGVDRPPQRGLASASEDLFIPGSRGGHGYRIDRSFGRTRGPILVTGYYSLAKVWLNSAWPMGPDGRRIST
jgi:hypothetical protein